MSNINKKISSVNWCEFLEYDETVSTCLRWKFDKIGNGDKLIPRRNNNRAGGINHEGYLTLNYGKSSFSIPKIIWTMCNGEIPENFSVYFKDNNCCNPKISNLFIREINYSLPEKYSSEMNDYIKYDDTSPSGLRWIAKTGKSSKVKIGDVVGSLDKLDGYWKLHGLGFHYKIHRLIWWLCKGEIPKGMYIDHINGIRNDNRIENLRIVSTELNARNRKMHKNNKTGHNMIAYSETFSKKGTLIRKYTVSINLMAWQSTSKSFSCVKYGDDVALQKALEWRDSHLKIMNDNNHGFTDRHGVPQQNN